jgi:hypothetical protein
MSNSLVKFAQRKQSSDGQRIFWNRAGIDGLPFRGPAPPIMPEEEFESRVVRVADAQNNFFDVTDPVQNQKYLEVVDAICNGWFKLVHIERFWRETTKHYVEWVEYYLEDGTRTPFSTQQQIIELESSTTPPNTYAQ